MLAADKGGEPAVDKEYLSVSLQIWELGEGSCEKGKRQIGMFDRIERPECSLDPAFRDLFIANEIIPEFGFALGRADSRPGRVCVAFGVVGCLGFFQASE